ncbi:MAG: phytoene/squalene synthase family protein [Pseudomonadota bacterium]
MFETDKRDAEHLRDTIRQGSKSFYMASRMLPPDVRAAAFALYAFCRDADDAVDDDVRTPSIIASLNRRLDAAYARRPWNAPIDRAFSETVHAYAIPQALPAALIEGFAWDLDGRTYRSLEDLHAYAARVAGTVGAMMCLVMGVRSAEALARATDLGAAMQLTNIARDVGDDARMGRIYLPLEWLRDNGVDPELWLANPTPNQGIKQTVAMLLDEASKLYARGLSGVSHLPRNCRTAIAAAGLVYSEIGNEIRSANFDSVTRRAVVSKSRKAALLTQAALGIYPTADAFGLPALRANQFLIDSAARPDAQPEKESALLPPAAMLDVLLRLQQRQRTQALS